MACLHNGILESLDFLYLHTKWFKTGRKCWGYNKETTEELKKMPQVEKIRMIDGSMKTLTQKEKHWMCDVYFPPFLFLDVIRVLKERQLAPSLSHYPAATSSSVLPLNLTVRDRLSVTLQLFWSVATQSEEEEFSLISVREILQCPLLILIYWFYMWNLILTQHYCTCKVNSYRRCASNMSSVLWYQCGCRVWMDVFMCCVWVNVQGKHTQRNLGKEFIWKGVGEVFRP